MAFQKRWRPEPWSLFSKEWWFCDASLADFRTQHIHQRCIEEAGCASTETSWSFRERGVKMVPKRHWNHISSSWTSLAPTLRHRESTFFTVCWTLKCEKKHDGFRPQAFHLVNLSGKIYELFFSVCSILKSPIDTLKHTGSSVGLVLSFELGHGLSSWISRERLVEQTSSRRTWPRACSIENLLGINYWE